MAGVPAVKGEAFAFYVTLTSQADTDIFQVNPTLAAGDAKVSIDGGALTNLATLPDVEPDGGKVVRVQLSADEMNGDVIGVVFSDAAGDEWQDLYVEILTDSQQIGDLATSTALATVDGNVDAILADTGTDGVVLADDAITSAKFDESTAFPLGSADSGSTEVARTGADGDTLETLSDQLDSSGAVAGSGAITWVYTLTNAISPFEPIADADVWVTTDVGGDNVIASGKTDAFGEVTFYLDAGTVYVWRQKSGWDFSNPDTEVVS